MNTRNIIRGLSAVAIAVTCASAAFADDEGFGQLALNNQTYTQVAIAKYRSENAPLGVSALGVNPDRIIKINAATKYLNVNKGEVVAIVSGDKTFTWKFDTLGAPAFELAKIAPQDFGSGKIRVYVSEVVESD